MNDLRAILFDLDDTLYEEASYVRSGLTAVAAEIAAVAAQPAAAVTAHLLGLFAAQGRERIFDHALAHYGIAATPALMVRLVALYREHSPQIALYPGVAGMLARLRQRYRLAIVTDGLVSMQQHKIAALGLAETADAIVYTWAIERPKPSPDGYRDALRQLDCAPEQAIIVGDNPAHDMAAAVGINMAAVRVRTGRFAALPNPPGLQLQGDVERVTELEALLA